MIVNGAYTENPYLPVIHKRRNLYRHRVKIEEETS